LPKEVAKKVARRFHETGLYSRKPALCIPFTASYKTVFAMVHTVPTFESALLGLLANIHKDGM